MKHYTDTIPLPLAEKLKEKGMPTPKQILCNFFPSYENEKEEYTYGFVFDWLMSEKEMRVYVVCCSETFNWRFFINYGSERHPTYYSTWHEAAEKAIEKALTLI